MEPVWVRQDVVVQIQKTLTATGVRVGDGQEGRSDPSLLSAALSRPEGLKDAKNPPSIARLAAAYASGIVSNRPFGSDNTRMAFLVASMFLHMNGLKLIATSEDSVLTFRGLADGMLSEEPLAAWFESNTAPR
jgi:death-on-curing protein